MQSTSLILVLMLMLQTTNLSLLSSRIRDFQTTSSVRLIEFLPSTTSIANSLTKKMLIAHNIVILISLLLMMDIVDI